MTKTLMSLIMFWFYYFKINFQAQVSLSITTFCSYFNNIKPRILDKKRYTILSETIKL